MCGDISSSPQGLALIWIMPRLQCNMVLQHLECGGAPYLPATTLRQDHLLVLRTSFLCACHGSETLLLAWPSSSLAPNTFPLSFWAHRPVSTSSNWTHIFYSKICDFQWRKSFNQKADFFIFIFSATLLTWPIWYIIRTQTGCLLIFNISTCIFTVL